MVENDTVVVPLITRTPSPLLLEIVSLVRVEFPEILTPVVLLTILLALMVAVMASTPVAFPSTKDELMLSVPDVAAMPTPAPAPAPERMTWLKETDVTAFVPKMSFAELLTVKFDTLSEPLEA
jgi:hypothetical protein